MRSMRWTSVLAAVALAGLSLAAGAQGPPPDGGMGMGPHRPPMERAMGQHGEFGRWWNNQKLVDKYKLNDSQRKAMDDIYQQHRLTLVDLHATLEKAELAMEPMMREDQPDENKILSQIDRIASARAELEKANAKMLFEIRRQLTPDQWKQIQADRASRASQHGPMGAPGAQWRGRGPGNAPQGGPEGSAPLPPNGPGENE